jgi:hypothetical protein
MPGLPALTDRLDSLARETLSGSAMSNETENSMASVLAAIDRVRHERFEVTLKYDSALAKLIAAGRDLGAEIPDDVRSPEQRAVPAQMAADASAHDQAPEPTERSADQIGNGYLAKLPAYWGCPFCDFFHPMGWYADCRHLNEEERANISFIADDLSEEYGKEGWIPFFAHESATKTFIPVGSKAVDHFPQENDLLPVGEASASNSRTTDKSDAPHGIREGATKHRVLMITRELLPDREQVPIKEIFDAAQKEGIFANAHNPKQYLHNILYQLRVRSLLTSDGRGNWSLPAGEGGR